MKRWWQDTRGMSLMEVIVAVAVIAMIAGSMASVLVTSLRTNWKANNNVQSQQNARIGLDKLTRDLRQAGRLYSSLTSFGGFTFQTLCTPSPQISFVLPHVAMTSLNGGTQIWAPDPRTTDGKIPYDGWYVSYYLAPTSGGATQNGSGPYLVRASWNLVGTSTLSTQTAAQGISGLAFLDRVSGVCPSAASASPQGRDIKVTLTSTQYQADQTTVVSTTTMTQDVTLRNAWQ